MALVKRKIHRLLLMASLLLAAICYSLTYLNQRRQTSELATGRQTTHEDPTAATSTATIPTKLNISTRRQTNELATGRETAHEDPTAATSTATIPSKLNISTRRQTSELATGRQTSHEDPTAATSTATIPTKLNVSTRSQTSELATGRQTSHEDPTAATSTATIPSKLNVYTHGQTNELATGRQTSHGDPTAATSTATIPTKLNVSTRRQTSELATGRQRAHEDPTAATSTATIPTKLNVSTRRQTSELATGRQTAHEDPTAATSTATIPSRLNISTQTRSSISTARISRNISRTSISARVPSTTPPSTLLAQLWSKWSSESALPKVPEAQLQCSDAICSNLSPPNLKCMNRIPDLVKRMAAPTCRFQKGESKPKYLLRSFPGSGNTWVRQVLEKATGICTGSIYCDSDIMLSGMIGEGVDSSSVLVVKTHNPKTPGNATIFIVRNPINAIVSFWKWQLIYTRMYKTEEKIHVANPPVRYFRNNPRWNNSIRGEVNYWTNLIKGTLSKTNKPLLIVTYEDIKSNTTREVFRMLDFLNVEYSAEEIIEKFKDDQLTMFKRPKARDFDPYTPPQRDRVRTRLKQLSTSLHHKTMVEIIKRYLLEL